MTGDRKIEGEQIGVSAKKVKTDVTEDDALQAQPPPSTPQQDTRETPERSLSILTSFESGEEDSDETIPHAISPPPPLSPSLRQDAPGETEAKSPSTPSATKEPEPPKFDSAVKIDSNPTSTPPIVSNPEAKPDDSPTCLKPLPKSRKKATTKRKKASASPSVAERGPTSAPTMSKAKKPKTDISSKPTSEPSNATSAKENPFSSRSAQRLQQLRDRYRQGPSFITGKGFDAHPKRVRVGRLFLSAVLQLVSSHHSLSAELTEASLGNSLVESTVVNDWKYVTLDFSKHSEFEARILEGIGLTEDAEMSVLECEMEAHAERLVVRPVQWRSADWSEAFVSKPEVMMRIAVQESEKPEMRRRAEEKMEEERLEEKLTGEFTDKENLENEDRWERATTEPAGDDAPLGNEIAPGFQIDVAKGGGLRTRAASVS